ncbi:MAG: hypothetical protein Q7U91_00240 [Sideroxyarcus sp.]|nr:hypothetical protein [Sideroxyarcus sp.]
MKMIDLQAVIVLSLLSGAAFAEIREDKCVPDVYETVSRSMKNNEFSPMQDGSNVISAACRTWPYKTSLLLAAFAYDDGVEYEKRLIVAVIDEKTKRVISSYRSVIGEDAVTEVGGDSLKLDTARYQLAKDVRAFGVKFNSSAHGANCGEAYWGDELTLFVPEGKTLSRVLSLNLYQQRWIKGCPAATSQALWEDAMLTVSMADTSTNGFHDIVVTAKITVTADGTPTGNHRDRIERHTLHYDGTTYQKGQTVPWWLAI